MFRNLTNEKAKKFKKKQKEVFHECLVDPGPDLVNIFFQKWKKNIAEN